MMQTRVNNLGASWPLHPGVGPDKLKLGRQLTLKRGLQRGLQRGFTIAEMLVVIVIIGLLAALVLPNIRGHSESVAINAACRQLVDDLSFARQKAISQRSTVAVVFIPPSVLQFFQNNVLTKYSPNEIAFWRAKERSSTS